MFAQLLKRITTPDVPPSNADEMQHAVAVLLIEAARMDDTFDSTERTAIEKLLQEKFALSADELRQLLARAETTARQSSQIHPFTRLAVTRMNPEQRIRLIEMLWEVVYSDGALDPEEDVLLRRVAGLIYVTDEDRVAARRRVIARLGL